MSKAYASAGQALHRLATGWKVPHLQSVQRTAIACGQLSRTAMELEFIIGGAGR